MNVFLKIVYYDAIYDGIFVILSHDEMLEWYLQPNEARYEVLEISLIIEEV